LRYRDPSRHNGNSQTPEYACWAQMKARCLNPNHRSYSKYGGRGITVSEDWLDFDKFLKDMGCRPSEAHSLERINNDLGYSKENCEWAVQKEQVRNRRNTKMIEFEGKRIPLAAACEITGVNYMTAFNRLAKGYSVETSLSPIKLKSGRPPKVLHSYKGEVLSLNQVSDRTGIPFSVLYWKVNVKKMKLEEALK
jgi:hypothetical protein